MATLALDDWHYPIPINSDFRTESARDYVWIITARPTITGLLVLGLLNVACKIVEPLEVSEHGVFANFQVDDLGPYAFLNILPKSDRGNLDLTTYAMEESSKIPPLNSTSSNNATKINVIEVPDPSSTKPLNSSVTNMGYYLDPLDPDLKVMYRQLSTTYEDVDLWTAFLTALALAATFPRDAGSASITYAGSSRRNCQVDILNWDSTLTYYQIGRVLLIVWDNLMSSKKGSGESVTRFPGVMLDFYYGGVLIGTGSVGDYKPPPRVGGTGGRSGDAAIA